MAVFKCKMCGGALEIQNSETIAVCEYCGTKQTVPTAKDENLQGLYNRANTLRIKSEFDKAEQLYEKILQSDGAQAEAYWGLILCKYGIEYVEDPKTFKRMPTCHRASFDSIIADEDYKSAVQYADASQREIYENEAKEIDRIQKEIIELSAKEEPYDVFICYKETDENGKRTQDSAIANDIYYQLTNEGFKVFYAAITLEDKLGSAYEPCIFAALNSAKVMLAIGTKPEYFNAVWVKNEWSRYLKIIKKDRSKLLIPCYKDMDAYELPEEFAHLQAQDMGKIGFINDIVRGIKKVVDAQAPKATVVKKTVVSSEPLSSNITALLKRGFMALEDSEWSKADDFFEQALNQNAELSEAYLGKLMAELHVKSQDKLKDCEEAFDNTSNYQKVMRFADNNLKTFLSNTLFEKIYIQACNRMALNSITGYREAMQLFDQISDYKDAAALANECEIKAEDVRKEEIYNRACDVLNDTHTWVGKKTDIKAHEEAIVQFQSLDGWKDSNEKILLCQKKIEEIKAQLEEQRLAEEQERLEKERQVELDKIKAEARAKRNKKIAIITTPIVCVTIAIIIVLNYVIIPTQKRNAAIEKYGEEFVTKFESLNIGDTYKFGSYEQNNNSREDIEWIVLSKEDTKILVISKYALDCKRYNTSRTDVTWETCSLRKWLNNEFINSAFSDDEKAMIPTVTVSADKNTEYDTNSGNPTQDKVFLLSITEVNKHFGSDSARRCKPTDYAVANGAWENDSGNCWWWLRSPGYNHITATIIYSDGAIYDYGKSVDDFCFAVRPAMWIDLSKVK